MNTFRITLLTMLVFTIFSCGDNGNNEPETPTDDFERKTLLIDMADGIIIPAFENYVAEVKTLNSSAQSFAVNPDQDKLDLLRGYWLNAYKAWQYVSMFNIGKAEEVSLRNFTNIYPTDATLIEENIANGEYNLLLPSKNDEQGFPALDYLLYGIGEDDAAILEKFNDPAYATYLTDLTERLEALATSVLDDWNGGYRDAFIENDGSSATSSLNKIVNDYIFYYEKFLRAGKIGIPAGVFSGSPFSNKVEAYYAGDVSKELFMEGLEATKRFFNGIAYETDAQGTGFKAYLDYLNTIKEGTDLSTLINNQFDQARIKAEMLKDNFAEQVDSDNIKMLETYDELQKNVVLLKVDMLQAFNVKVDFVDADGD